MTDAVTEIPTEVEEDDKKVDKETDSKEQPKQRSVSFNRDVHVKRFGKLREGRGVAREHTPPTTRKEPFTHLSEKQLIEEANKVLAQAQSVSCTADHPPEKFFSLPHRRKFRPDQDRSTNRRNSDDLGTSSDGKTKTPLGRSTSDVTPKKRGKERTSLSTLFRRAQKSKSPEIPVIVTTKPVPVIKRSKSDVSDLKSNTTLNINPKPIRKRSGSETEEFLKSLRNKKTQLSPIIESSPREDYFKRTSPLDLLQTSKEPIKTEISNETSKEIKKINPIEKPPRYKTPEKENTEPKPPARSKRAKSVDTKQESSPSITDTPKRKTEVKKTLLVDEIDKVRGKDINFVEVKDRIKDSIKKIKDNVYSSKEMIHSSQQPQDKPPLTRGHTVDQIVRILKEDLLAPPPKAHLIAPPNNGTNNNQPFSYIKPSVSPDPKLYTRPLSPDRPLTPVNKMNPEKGVVYAQVVRGEQGGSHNLPKQTVHKTYSPSREYYTNVSDEDEGLGYEENRNRHNYTDIKYNDINKDKNFNSLDGYRVIDSPITPKFKEYKLTSFVDFEPTYANGFPDNKNISRDFIDTTFRGRADGMDSKRKNSDTEITKINLDFNELSHRRQLLESRLNARRYERNERSKPEETVTTYFTETDPIYEAQKKMKATEKYVNDTARYYRHTLERNGYVDNKFNDRGDDFATGDIDRSEYLDKIRSVETKKIFPPEPEYEPPSLESNSGRPILTPNEYTEKKYKLKNRNINSSHEVLQTGQKYFRGKDDSFGKRKGHYASNPEIAQEREDDYENAKYDPKYSETYHNSLRRDKNRDKYYYRDDRSPRRYDHDNRLVDSGIENDFRKDSSGEIHRNNTKYRRGDSDDEVLNSNLLIASERRHTEDNYPSEKIYANGEYITRFENFARDNYPTRPFIPRERNVDDGSHFDPRIDRFDKSPTGNDENITEKPPKVAKKLSGLEKVKQLFSRDSSKKSKKEKEPIQSKTRILKSPEHLVREDNKRYEQEPSDDERRFRSRNVPDDLNRPKSDRRKSDDEIKRKSPKEGYGKYEEEYKEKFKEYRGSSDDRDSDHRNPRPSENESKSREFSKKIKSRTTEHMDSPAMAERYKERRRLATPSPTPSLPRQRSDLAPPTSAGNWFKSLDRLARKRTKNKAEKEVSVATGDKIWSKSKQPAKNLRFFGDTDQDSDANVSKHSAVTKSKSHPQSTKTHSLLRKTTSNSSTGIDEIDQGEISKSYSLSNLQREESPTTKTYYKRNLKNISEMSNSETDSHFGRKVDMKPPISPYERNSRSHSASKNVKSGRNGQGSRSELRTEERISPSELKGSKQELSREIKPRRRTPAPQSGESSTEGESSHHSQRSVVYLHATTVGDIPDPGMVSRGRSRDDVSSINSSQLQVRSTAKSFSIFAPWTPRHAPDHYDLHYEQRPRRTPKPPKESNLFGKKSSSTRHLNEDRPGTLQKNRSSSQTTLSRRPPNSRLTNSSSTLYRKEKRNGKNNSRENISTLSRTKEILREKEKKSQSTETLTRDSERISRSISMPKENGKKAGWFKLTSKNKKPELNTRVR